MTQSSTTKAAADEETMRPNLAVPVDLWDRAKVQAARQRLNLQEFSVKAIEFLVTQLEEEHRREILADAKKKGY